jgi:putative DNA primase/helicase
MRNSRIISTTGGDRPFGEGAARRGDVIYVTAEDSAAQTIRPRLEAAGSNLQRVHIIECVNDHFGPRPFSLVADLAQLEHALQALRRPRLVIIDPINACLSATGLRPFNPNSVPRVRALLRRLEELAGRYRVAIVCVTHFTKGKGAALFRVTGSFAFVAAARSEFMVTRNQDDPDQRLLAPLKKNFAVNDHAVAFRIKLHLRPATFLAPYVEFVSPSRAI